MEVKEKGIELKYVSKEEANLTIAQISSFLSEMDDILIDSIKNRSYFVSYDDLAAKFLQTGHIFCCFHHDKLVGLVVFYANPKNFEYAYETYVGVLKEYNGLGIASSLVQAEIKRCLALGIKGVMTNCHVKNERKRGLNLKMGFKAVTDNSTIEYFENMNPKWEGKIFYTIDF